jgi:hypothetical protein
MIGTISRQAMLAIARMKARSFRVVFDAEGKNGREVGHVLAALRAFCAAQTPAIGATPEETYRLNGRRDVWLFIQDKLNFNDRQVAEFVEAEDEYFGD